MTVARVRVCSVVEEYLDGLQEASLGGVVQSGRVECIDTARTAGVTRPAVVGAGTVSQEGADVVRIVLATLVSRAACTDPRAGGVDRRAAAGE